MWSCDQSLVTLPFLREKLNFNFIMIDNLFALFLQFSEAYVRTLSVGLFFAKNSIIDPYAFGFHEMF